MITVDTPFGPMELTPTGVGRIFCDANSNGKFITINGVQVCTSFNIALVDGEWRFGDSYLRASRRNWQVVSQMDASSSAKRKIHHVLIPHLCEWAAANADDAELTAAEYRAQEIQLRINEDKIARLRTELAELETKRGDILTVLDILSARLNGDDKSSQND